MQPEHEILVLSTSVVMSLMIANSTHSDEMASQGLHCLPMSNLWVPSHEWLKVYSRGP